VKKVEMCEKLIDANVYVYVSNSI